MVRIFRLFHTSYCRFTLTILLLLAMVCSSWLVENPSATGANANDFTQPYGPVKPVQGTRPLLVILLGPNDPNAVPTVTPQQIHNRIFGASNSVHAYFYENSYHTFTVSEAFITPWLVAQDDPATTVDESSFGFVYSIDKLEEKSAWVIKQVETMTSFRFSAYDRSPKDGKITIEELAILWVYPGGGNARARGIRPEPVKVGSLTQGVQIGTLIRGGEDMTAGMIAHELAHQLLNLGDLYSDGVYPGVGEYSLMCDSAAHLDPWTKIKLGWLRPTVVTNDGWYDLADVETIPQAYILHNPTHGVQEYFVVENRWPGTSEERVLIDRGLAVWRIEERYAGQDDWARKTFALVAADGSVPPASIQPDTCPSRPNALWDGADAATAYALTSSSWPATLRWSDGSASEIAIAFVSTAAPLMHLYIDMPPLATREPVVSSGSSSQLDQYRTPYAYTLAANEAAHRIVGSDIAKNDQTYVWYVGGTASVGSTRALDSQRTAAPYALPPGKSPADIVGIAIAKSNDYVYAWYGDGTVSAGTYTDLTRYRPPAAYTLPPGKTPQDIVEISIAKDDRVFAWYTDGTVSIGSSRDLDQHRSPYTYSLPPGKSPQDVVGIGIAGSDDHVYAWYGTPILVGMFATGPAISVDRSTEIVVIAHSQDGKPLPGAMVTLATGGGAFAASGDYAVSGVTQTNGSFTATWHPAPRSAYTQDMTYLFTVEVAKPGYEHGQTTTKVLVMLGSV